MNQELRDFANIEKTIHEPAGLMIAAMLSAVDEADFLYLLKAMNLTNGNLSCHLSRLEKTGFVEISKSFVGKTPRTVCRLTPEDQDALKLYRQQMKAVI